MILKTIKKASQQPALTQRIWQARKPAQKIALTPQAVIATIKKTRQKSK